MNYILEGHEPKQCDDLGAWAKWYETADRRVALDEINDVTVSTVFLGLDHNFDEGEPILFETMVFGGFLDQETERYSTYAEAETGHAAMVKRVKSHDEEERKMMEYIMDKNKELFERLAKGPNNSDETQSRSKKENQTNEEDEKKDRKMDSYSL